MMKLLAAALMLTLPFTASAELSETQVKKEIAGQYRMQEGRRSLMFIVRSSGAIEIPENQDFPFAGGRMTLNYSSNGASLDGLPVAHIVIGVGSDEDITDYHILLTVAQDQEANTVQLAAQFTTFNDGPNKISNVEQTALRVSKYDRASGKYEELR
jgi:hypothetical protein